MDAPPPKRRRTSPRLAGRAGSDGLEAAANDNSNSNDNNSADVPLPRSKIPLFASPTRASLARHNPEILERRRSASRGPSAPPPDDRGRDGGEGTGDGTVRPLQQPAIRSPQRNNSPRRSALSQSPTRSPVRPPTRRPAGLYSEPAVQSPTRGKQQQGGGGRGVGGGVDVGDALRTALPQRTPVAKPVPRPLPPPEPTRAEDVLEPLVEAARARQRRAAAANGGDLLDLFRGPQAANSQDDQPPAEPELPPTPEHPDPELTTSPPGIHNGPSSTPSKRPGRPRGRPTKANNTKDTTAPSSSSPLKQPPLQPASVPTKVSKPAKPAFPKQKRPGKEGTVAAATTEPSSVDNDGARVTRSAAVRGIKPPDADAAKKKERDALLAEIAALEADLVLAGMENERIRKTAEEMGGSAATQLPPADVREDLLKMLHRRVPSLPGKGGDDAAAADPAGLASWLQGAANPIALLPFGKPAGADELSALLGDLSSSSANEDDTTAAIASHRPIPMTAVEELPYLQAFTPLVFSSQIVLLPADASATLSGQAPSPLFQKHQITVASASPHSSLFCARIDMTVHATSLRVTDLHVPRIEPRAAAAELQPLLARCGVRTDGRMDGRMDGMSDSSALLRNITILTWAMGEWVRVAVRRARFWVALERRLQEKGGGANNGTVGAAGQPPKRKRGRPRGTSKAQRGKNGLGQNDDDEDSDNDDDDSDSDDSDDNLVVSEAELLAHAGRTAMDVDVPFEEQGNSGGGGGGRGLRVQWTIQFDWTGEARSELGLLVGVPGKWRKADDRGRLAALPRLFDQLVHGHTDPATAVVTVVALLSGGR